VTFRGDDVRHSRLNAELVKRFPDLSREYLALKTMWDGDEPGPHVVYGDTLVPKIRRLLASGRDPAEAKRVFNFLEFLSSTQEEEIEEVVVVSVLEALHDDREVWEAAKDLMGARTRRFAAMVEQGRQRPQDSPGGKNEG
jgi:hypothetical protein